MRNMIKATFYAGVGLMDKLREEVNELVERGELKKQEAEELVEQAEEETRNRMQDVQDKIESAVKSTVAKLPPVALRNELAELEARVSALEARMKALKPAAEEPAHAPTD